MKVPSGQSMKNNIFTSSVIFFIRFYQLFFSPLLGANCRFYPTCSAYSIQALKKYGLLKGIILGSKRVLSCHPFGSYGFKPLNEDNIPLIKKSLLRKFNLREKINYIKIFLKAFQSTMKIGLSLQFIWLFFLMVL